MHRPKPILLRIVLLMMIILTSCGREDSAQKNPEIKFDQDSATRDIINQTLPKLIRDSAELIALPFYSDNPNKSIRDQEYKEARMNHRNLIDSVGMALYLDSILFVPEPSEVEWMIEKGGSELFKRFYSESLSEMVLDLSKIKNYGRVELTTLHPQTSSEMDRYYGFASYSRILFHSNNKKAFFIFRTSRFRDCMSAETYAVEVELIDKKWKIMNQQ